MQGEGCVRDNACAVIKHMRAQGKCATTAFLRFAAVWVIDWSCTVMSGMHLCLDCLPF